MTTDTLKRMQQSPVEFRKRLVIDCDGSPKPLASVLDDWQRQDFERLDDAWRAVAGQDVPPGTKLRSWCERPRGHSKSGDLAVQIVWCMFAARRPIRGIIAAGDRDQAALLRSAILTLVRHNSWLGGVLKITNWRVENTKTGSSLDVISSDVASSWGHLVDFVCCDELTHWPNRDLFDSLISTAAKRKRCLFAVIGNAGFQESWAWQVREAIRVDPSWHFSRLESPCASWISQEALNEQRRLLPLVAYRRLWENVWSSGSGDALSADDITAACRLTGPTSTAERGWHFVAGLDIGLARDAAALCVLGIHHGYSERIPKPRQLTRHQQLMIEAGIWNEPPREYDEKFVPATGRLMLADLRIWHPRDSATGRVDLQEIEECIYELHQRFRLQLGADPYQSEHLAQRLIKRGVPVELVPFTPLNLTQMCSTVLERFSSGLIDLYPDEQLLHDLHNLRVVEKSYGVRLDSPRTLRGHGDAATALAISMFLNSKIAKFNIGAFSQTDRLIVA